jgi:hypothetical protein
MLYSPSGWLKDSEFSFSFFNSFFHARENTHISLRIAQRHHPWRLIFEQCIGSVAAAVDDLFSECAACFVVIFGDFL